jgi:hypothetical protein
MTAAFDGERVKALVFDVFGTVVDWRGSIITAGAALTRDWGLALAGTASPMLGAPRTVRR